MERRTLLAIFLSLLVLFVYQQFAPKPPKPPVPTRAPNSQAARSDGKSTSASADAAATAPATTADSSRVSHPASAPPPALVSDASKRDIKVETRDVIAVFTNKGGRLESWRLKHYLDRDKQPQELVETGVAGQPLPFSLQTSNEAANDIVNDALYKVTGAPDGPVQDAPVDLQFEYRDTAGLHVLKEFHLEPSSYIATVRATVEINQESEGSKAHAEGAASTVPVTILWGPAVGDISENTRYIQKPSGILFQNDRVVRLAPKDFAKQSTYEGDFRYAGVDDNYFMTVALFPGTATLSFRPVSIPPPPGSSDPARDLVAYSIETKSPTPVKFFAGPKDFDVLASIDLQATKAINFGMFAVIVVPLLRSLKWVHGYVGNYGWSIVVLTVIINVITFPIRHKGVVSMRKMQEIQPEVKAIQDRYAKLKTTDPAKQKMNQELMALYREKGVNPVSGCVPQLLTLPILWAMWSLLSTAIELRGAPFFGWIHDLTAHDPFYVTPILMGASQLWQQRLTPATGGDPAQQKMMMFMPVVFTFMFLWLPAGVTIYYAASNLFGIGQQYLTNYLIGPPRLRAPRPPAERRAKAVAGAKGG
ncbi:MAG TPA: membrane protein insertase YidC [Vicinamibacterales bacterium]|nr:membrane protein insertase YidC [Vicinamibacterales bacterium]